MVIIIQVISPFVLNFVIESIHIICMLHIYFTLSTLSSLHILIHHQIGLINNKM